MLPDYIKDWCKKNNLDEVLVGMIYRDPISRIAIEYQAMKMKLAESETTDTTLNGDEKAS